MALKHPDFVDKDFQESSKNKSKEPSSIRPRTEPDEKREDSEKPSLNKVSKPKQSDPMPEKTEICDVCQKAYYRKSNLTRHKQKTHGTPKESKADSSDDSEESDSKGGGSSSELSEYSDVGSD